MDGHRHTALQPYYGCRPAGKHTVPPSLFDKVGSLQHWGPQPGEVGLGALPSRVIKRVDIHTTPRCMLHTDTWPCGPFSPSLCSSSNQHMAACPVVSTPPPPPRPLPRSHRHGPAASNEQHSHTVLTYMRAASVRSAGRPAGTAQASCPKRHPQSWHHVEGTVAGEVVRPLRPREGKHTVRRHPAAPNGATKREGGMMLCPSRYSVGAEHAASCAEHIHNGFPDTLLDLHEALAF